MSGRASRATGTDAERLGAEPSPAEDAGQSRFSVTLDSPASEAMSSSDEPEFKMADVSMSQRMLSATTGSFAVSVLATPLDVVRVRLQSQPSPPASSSANSASSLTALRTSAFRSSAAGAPSATRFAELGVTACCREVFWAQNQAQYCLAPNGSAAVSSAGALGALSSPQHVSSPSLENCSVEETRRKAFTSTFDGLRKIARNEGVTTLWRGLSPTLLMAIPANVIYFTGYDYLRSSRSSPLYHRVPDNYAPLVAGAAARIAAAVAVSPIEMFRTRMQAHPGGTGSVFMATLTGLGDVVRSQGYTSLWRGLTLTMWRDVPFSGIYWWGYEAVRNTLTDARDRRYSRANNNGEDLVPRDDPLNMQHRRRAISRSRDNVKTTFMDSVIAGATSGAVASVVTTPFDVGKTRQQVFAHASDIRGSGTGMKKAAGELRPEERSMPRFLYHILRTEGAAGLFKGGVARCLKVAPACAIMISSYEVGKKTAQKANARRDDTAVA